MRISIALACFCIAFALFVLAIETWYERHKASVVNGVLITSLALLCGACGHDSTAPTIQRDKHASTVTIRVCAYFPGQSPDSVCKR